MAESIEIRIIAIDEFSAVMNKAVTNLQSFNNISTRMTAGKTKKITEIFDTTATSALSMADSLKIARISQATFDKEARKNFLVNQEGVGMMDQLTGKTMSYGQAARNAAIMSRRFKFEYLSVMFAGMALDRVLGGIIKTQMELFGVSGLLADAWTIVMLDVMDQITPKLYDMIDAFMNLPESMKLGIGWGILLGDSLAKILSAVGQIVLGFMGFKMIFPGTFAAISGWLSGLGSGFLALAGIIAIAAGIIAAIIIGMYIAWKNNFLGMQETVNVFVTAIKNIFGGLISIFSGILTVIKALFTGDFELLKEGLIKIIKGMADVILNIFVALGSGIVAIITGVLQIVTNIINIIIQSINYLAGKILSLMGMQQTYKLPTIPTKNLPTYQTGGLVPKTGPAILHQGEMVIPRNQIGNSTSNSNITVSPIYYINVSDKYEMEKLLRDNNLKLVDEIKRMVNT